MLDLLASQPRMLVGAVVGALAGFACALVIRHFYPALSITAGAVIVAVALAVGVALGVAWEARRS